MRTSQHEQDAVSCEGLDPLPVLLLYIFTFVPVSGSRIYATPTLRDSNLLFSQVTSAELRQAGDPKASPLRAPGAWQQTCSPPWHPPQPSFACSPPHASSAASLSQVAGHLFEGEAGVPATDCAGLCTSVYRGFACTRARPLAAPSRTVPRCRSAPHVAMPFACPHPTLCADGKAGSLIDDRGHFYKPLQRGPRGDRERAFYAAIAELLQAEAAAQPAGAAAAGCQEPALHVGGRAAGSSNGASPVCLNGGSARGSPFSAWQEAPRAGDGSPAVKLPWKSAKQLMELFPSFKASQRERGPMEVMQVGAARWVLGACPYAAAVLFLCCLVGAGPYVATAWVLRATKMGAGPCCPVPFATLSADPTGLCPHRLGSALVFCRLCRSAPAAARRDRAAVQP